jgi:hypothetical protein
MSFEDLLFRRGYYICGKAPEGSETARLVTSRWVRRDFGRTIAYTEPALEVHEHRDGGTALLLLGFAVDPLGGIRDCGRILEMLHTRLYQSTDAFYDYLDTLSGRFALLILTPTSRVALHDASGNRSLFYHFSDYDFVLTSHSQLAAEILGLETPPDRRAFMDDPAFQTAQLRRLPGDQSPFSGLHTLTPNMLLDIDRRRVRRFFPRRPMQPRRITTDLIEEISSYLTSLMRLLAERQPLTLALTAGIDSRLAMAALKGLTDSMTFFTFHKEGSPITREDVKLATQIAQHHGLEHYPFKASIRDMTDEQKDFLGVFLRTSAHARPRVRAIVAHHMRSMLPANALHLKCSISEVMRAFYRKEYAFLPTHVSIPTLCDFYGIQPKADYTRRSMASFVRKVRLEVPVRLGYDVCAMFHWEQAMGMWQSLQTQDFDQVL